MGDSVFDLIIIKSVTKNACGLKYVFLKESLISRDYFEDSHFDIFCCHNLFGLSCHNIKVITKHYPFFFFFFVDV